MELRLKEVGEEQEREASKWRHNCDKLTSSLGRKETEIQHLHKKLDDIESQVPTTNAALALVKRPL